MERYANTKLAARIDFYHVKRKMLKIKHQKLFFRVDPKKIGSPYRKVESKRPLE